MRSPPYDERGPVTATRMRDPVALHGVTLPVAPCLCLLMTVIVFYRKYVRRCAIIQRLP
jgi:hypothetical protein